MISVIGATLKKLRDDAHDASLSPDGSQIVFRDAVTHEIWLMSADGSQAHLFLKPETGYHLFRPSWFPKGKRISYVVFRETAGVVDFKLENRNLQANDPAVLLTNPRYNDACWGGPGRLIYSQSETGQNQYDSNLWELRFDEDTGKPKGNPRQLTDWKGFNFLDPEMTADTKRLVFLNTKAQSDVYLSEIAQGGEELKPPQRLTLDDRLDWPGTWSDDGKTVFLYSDRAGQFDIYKQGVGDRNAQPVVSGPGEKWFPAITPDHKWILYMQWSKSGSDIDVNSGKLLRVPVGGGPPEAVTDLKGYAGVASGGAVERTVSGYPSFRCPSHASADCVLAEHQGDDIVFTAIDPVKGRKSEVLKLPAGNFRAWDISPDGTRIASTDFDYKAGEVQVVSLQGGAPVKLSTGTWFSLVAVAWAADGKSLFVASYSSRGTAILHMDLSGKTKFLIKPAWDIYALSPSPDGRYLAFGPIVFDSNAWTISPFPK